MGRSKKRSHATIEHSNKPSHADVNHSKNGNHTKVNRPKKHARLDVSDDDGPIRFAINRPNIHHSNNQSNNQTKDHPEPKPAASIQDVVVSNPESNKSTITATVQSPTISDPIAISICLVPASNLPIHASAVQINQSIYQSNQDLSFLYSDIRKPHATVVASYIRQSELDQLISELTEEIQSNNHSNNKLQLRTETQIRSPGLGKRKTPFLCFEKSNHLIDFHTRLTKIVDQYRLIDPSVKESNRHLITQSIEQYPSGSRFDHLIDSFAHADGDRPRYNTMSWVNDFGTKYSFDRYNPHITLGLVNKKTMDKLARLPADSLRFDWDPQEVAIYQIGDQGTIRRHITSIPFVKQQTDVSQIPAAVQETTTI